MVDKHVKQVGVVVLLAIAFKLSQAVLERKMIASRLREAAHEQGNSTPTSQEPGIKGS